MNTSREHIMRYFIGFIIAVGLIVLLIILIFSGGGTPKTGHALTSYATTDAVAKLTIDGPINAEQNHQQVQITVGRDTATYEQFQGYDGNETSLRTYPNSQNGYDAFLHALARAGFVDGNTSASLKDEGGYCALGDRYVFELIQDGKDIERFWATGCGGTHTYGGNLSLTLSLFRAQIPDYGSLTSQLSNVY